MNEINMTLDMLQKQVAKYARDCNNAVAVHLKENTELKARNTALLEEREGLVKENEGLHVLAAAIGAVVGFGLGASFVWCFVK